MTVVEWLLSKLPMVNDNDPYLADIINQAKEMEKQQQDEFAIEFAEWCDNEGYTQVNNLSLWKSLDDEKGKTSKELLEIFKKEKGL